MLGFEERWRVVNQYLVSSIVFTSKARLRVLRKQSQSLILRFCFPVFGVSVNVRCRDKPYGQSP
jgi:hypothetical protein